jgi:hypothetical protein
MHVQDDAANCHLAEQREVGEVRKVLSRYWTHAKAIAREEATLTMMKAPGPRRRHGQEYMPVVCVSGHRGARFI